MAWVKFVREDIEIEVEDGISVLEAENQSEVFEKWLDENASEYLTEDEMKDLKEKINAMTADVDSLNAQEGYRGTSYESVFLLSASEAGLRKVNEMYVPEQLYLQHSVDMVILKVAGNFPVEK